ncbi:MAG: hypothetical protein Q4A90_06725 [Streptococcus sp.]|nr:hypothetical protein [Streptococcus sp.]
MEKNNEQLLTKRTDLYVLVGFLCTCLLSWFLFVYQINIGHHIVWNTFLSIIFIPIYLAFVYNYLVSRRSWDHLPLIFNKNYQERGIMNEAVYLLASLFTALIVFGVILSIFGGNVTFTKEVFIPKGSQLSKQVFHPTRGNEKELISKTETKKRQVVVLYKLTCRKCQLAIPELLKRVNDNTKMIFIDGSSPEAKLYAKHYGVEEVSTVIVWEQDHSSVYSLASKEDEKIILNERSLNQVVQLVNE